MLEPTPHQTEEGEAVKKIASFKTAKGSVYTYDDEGKTTRFKAATNEQRPRRDITVFVPLSEESEREYLEALHMRYGDEYSGVYIIQRRPDNSAVDIWDVEEIEDPNKIYLAIITDGKLIKAQQVSLMPMQGYNTFDAGRSERGGQPETSRHLGSKVTEITYR